MFKLLFIPIDLIYLGLDSLKGLVYALRQSRRAPCPYCHKRSSSSEGVRRVEVADKYHNAWVFRLICPSVEDTPTQGTRRPPRQCTQVDRFAWSKARTGGGLLLCLLFWGGLAGALLHFDIPQRTKTKVAALLEQHQSRQAEQQEAEQVVEAQTTAADAFAAAQSGPLEERIQQLETAVMKDPGHTEARHQLIDHLMRETRYERALGHITEARKRQGKTTNQLPILELNEAFIELQYGLATQAVARLDALRPHLAGNVEQLIRAADIYLSAGQFGPAKQCLDQSEEASPDQTDTLYPRSRIALLEGDIAEARHLLERLPETERVCAAALQIEANIQAREGALDTVVDLLRQVAAREEDPFHAKAVFQLSNLLVAYQREDEARLITEGLSSSTNRISRQTGNLALAHLYLQKGLFDRAIAATERVLEDHPRQFNALIIQARAWHEQAEFAQAEKILLRLPERARMSQDVTFLLNRSRYMQGDSPKMVAHLEEAVSAHPENLQLLVDLGNAHYFAGRLEASRKVFDKYLAAHPDNIVVANNLANVLAEQESDLERAEALARQVVALAPANGLYTDTLGWILVKRDKASEARPYLEHTVRTLPLAPAARWHLASAYALLGEKDAARRHLKAAFALAPEFTGMTEARALQVKLERELR